MFIYYRDGALEKALWDEVERTMNDYFAYPGVKEWWATRKHWLTDEFRTVVEAIIAKNTVDLPDIMTANGKQQRGH